MAGDKMASSTSRLSGLQRDLLEAFFRREQGFVLTGGSALGGYHLGHRESKDLDLFSLSAVDLDGAERALAAAATSCGAQLSSQLRHPEFRRYLASRDDETTLVDLAIDRAPRIDPPCTSFAPVLVDSPREITANKICALLGRCEIRDLVDLRALLLAGQPLERALSDAAAKDGGVDAATLGWLLSELVIPEDVALPGELAPSVLDTFRQDLVQRLRRLAFPGGSPG
jgi:hypothetical protein